MKPVPAPPRARGADQTRVEGTTPAAGLAPSPPQPASPPPAMVARWAARRAASATAVAAAPVKQAMALAALAVAAAVREAVSLCPAMAPCEGDTPRCNEETDTCVECLVTEDCDAPTALCDPDQHFCVECLDNTDCTDPQSSFCDAGSCSPCQTNTDCGHLAATTVCDVPTGECVECTGADYASCGVNEDDEPLVCNSVTRTCTTEVEHGSGTCKPCVADAQCPLGQLLCPANLQ